MKTAKELIIPFSWEQREPVLLDRFFYVPVGIEYTKKNFSFFNNNLPIMIEYCSGNGQWITEKAKQFPELNWIGVEKKFERARKVWLKSHRQNLPNLLAVCSEGLIFTRYFAPAAVEIFINFPDPWPKRRHAVHRIVRVEFIQELLKVIITKGRVTCVTDDAKYKDQILQEFGKFQEWKLLFDVNEWPDYGRSFFNDLWETQGRTIHYLSFERI